MIPSPIDRERNVHSLQEPMTMKPEPMTAAARRAIPILLALVAGGCSSKISEVFLPNQGPEVRLTLAPVSTQDRYFYAYRMNWVGFDPDGRVDHFLVSIDPPRADSIDSPPRGECSPSCPDTCIVGRWAVTSKNERFVCFRATQPAPNATEHPVKATDPHVFAVAAVDNRGAVSAPVWRAFTSDNLAPKVTIESPPPRRDATPATPPGIRIHWVGVDEDGQLTQKPIRYKFRLFAEKEKDFPSIDNFPDHVLANPNFLRETFGPRPDDPRGFSDWDSSSADTTDKQYTNLAPQQFFLFAVTGFDEAGAYDPVFSTGSNLLHFYVTYAGLAGPQICMFNEFFQYCYRTGGYSTDPSRFFRVEIPADQSVTFNWIGLPPRGADVRSYRWVMDLQDLTNETRRTSEEDDWRHWSTRSLNTLSATVGPFDPDLPPEDPRGGREHFFYIESEDNNGLKSLGIIDFTVVRATFEKELLIVDDTRLRGDLVTSSGQIQPPTGTWPTRAELDTFFFARGGFPYKAYPAGTLSRPGVFNGYEFDTAGTRGLVTGIMPFGRLGQYKRVVWYTDAVSALLTDVPTHPALGSTSLRWMSLPGQPNTLSTFMKQGGEVWVFGGGIALANLGPWHKRGTDPNVFTPTDLELISGRMMYDFAKWQSEVTESAALEAGKNAPVVTGDPRSSPGRPWLLGPIKRPDNLDYTKLPDRLRGNWQSPQDPVPPLRTPNSFYLTQGYFAEILTKSNFIREDVDPSDEGLQVESTLDTLCVTAGFVPVKQPLMTYYHGPASSRFVFSGFPLWYFDRSEQIQVVDFVLNQIWGLPKTSVAAREPARLRAARAR